MRDLKRLHLWLRRLGQMSLAVALLCATALAARADGQAEIPQPVIPKPTVTVQGNLVVDNGKPTGFYELALCVRSGRSIVENASGTEVTEAAYATAIAGGAEESDYTITYYPFRTVAGTVNINTDVLTPVSWDLDTVVYGAWDKATSQYADATLNTASYARGIDLAATLDPDLYPETDPDVVANYIPDFTTGNLYGTTPVSVRLEAAGDPAMTNVTAQVDHYMPDAVNQENNSALLTLSAATTDNKSAIFKTDTPVVVVRFAYDLNRFSGLTTVNTAITGDGYNSITGTTSDAGFWLGCDEGARTPYGPKTPLTWLSDSSLPDPTGAANPSFGASDKLAADSRNHQVIWYSAQCGADAAVAQETTQFYYYLGANGDQRKGTAQTLVETPGDPYALLTLTQPRTTGYKVLTADPNNTDPEASGYTYFQNLLVFRDGSLKLKLVNAPTFRPTGKGGTMVLFYDWDDSFLGSMLIGKGDVRADVNEYVEKTMVHPDLRATQYLEGGNIPTDPAKLAEHQNLTDSIDREYTYRGKYSSKLDGTGVIRADDPDPNAAWDVDDPTTPGSEYKLTNKLDYAFYRHLDTVTTLEYQNASGSTVTERYITSAPLSSDPEAALYPWVYGWAVVEDLSAKNVKNWQSRRDMTKLSDVWTTIGVGELSNVDPAYDLAADSKGQSLPTSLPAGATAISGTGITTTYPAFIDPTAVTAPTAYSYALTGMSGYLRMADFSDAKSLLTRPGQDTIIVKAVYEPGTELADSPYQIISDPYYNKLNGEAASAGGAYAIELTVERANNLQADGLLRGSRRIREAVIRQDTTLDQKWIEDSVMGVQNDLSNPSIDIATQRTQTTYTKVDADNGEQITFTLALSARQNRVNYFLTDMYGYNFVTGGQRTDTNFNMAGVSHVIDNYNYLADDSARNDAMYDQQGIYYEAPRFAVKDGTHGYVLYGTLNYLMEQATALARGEMTRPEFNTICGYEEIADINLCFDDGATVPSMATQTRFRDAILAAAADCYASHQGDPNYWNSKLDCAELTYHQLQHYLSGKGLMSRAAADAITIDWCHLHAACFKDPEAAAAPKDWNDIVTFAADPTKADGIGLLTGGISGKVEELTFLRATSNGDPFPAGSAFQAKIVEAVGKLNAAGQPLTWVNIQYYIVEGLTPTGNQGLNKALNNYWWYDGATSKPGTPNNLVTLAAGAKAYTSGATLKDGSTVSGWRFGLAGIADVYLDNDGRAPGVVAPAWNRLTENLVAQRVVNGPDDESTVKFATYTDFETALLDAMDTADKAGIDPAADDLYWHKLQYHILHKDDPGYTFPGWATSGDGSPQTTEMEGYWWHNGGKLYVVKDLQSMLEIARLAIVEGDADAAKAWGKFTSFSNSAGDPIPELQYSKNFTGTLYTDADIAAFKTEIETMVTLPGAPTLSVADASDPMMKNNTWLIIQYYLIHTNLTDRLDLTAAGAESNTGYYWWKDGGSPKAPNIINWQGAFTAAFLELENGNTVAWANLKSTATLMRVSLLRNYDKLNPPADPIYEFSKLPLFDPEDLQDAARIYVQQKINEAVTADPTGHHHTVPMPTWFELQHYLVTGSWDVSGFTQDQLEERYWWFDGKAEDPNKPKEDPDKPMKDWVTKWMDSSAMIDTIKATDFSDSNINLKSTVTGTNVTALNLTTVKNRLKSLLTNAGAAATSLTWYQVQVALWPANAGGAGIGNGSYVDAATAKAAYKTAAIDKGKDWRPQWLTNMEAAEGASLLDDTPLEEVKPELEPETQETPETPEKPTLEELMAEREALLKKLAELERQLAALETQEETPAETPVETPVERPERPVVTPVETPVEPSVETPVEHPESPVVTPAEPPVETPVETPVGTPVETPEIPMGDEAVFFVRPVTLDFVDVLELEAPRFPDRLPVAFDWRRLLRYT